MLLLSYHPLEKKIGVDYNSIIKNIILLSLNNLVFTFFYILFDNDINMYLYLSQF